MTDSTLVLDEIDKDFYECIDKLRNAYVEMSPMFSFKGHVTATKIVYNKISKNRAQNNVVSLFSGGLDAYSTLIAHLDERPKTFTIWGADISLEDEKGWNIVRNTASENGNQFNLPEPAFVKSNFRTFLNVALLDEMVKESNDFWWHGYQHGIGMLGLAAPIAYKYDIDTIYIASSFSVGDSVICASFPTIDNNVRFAGCKVIHDQFEFSRQKKIEYVSAYCTKNHTNIPLRVCWKTTGAYNCCECEKCFRTIYGFLSIGQDPKLYNLNFTPRQIRKSKRVITKVLKDTPFLRPLWLEIINTFKDTKSCIDDKDINWVFDYDVNTEHSKIYKVYRKARFLTSKVYHSIMQ